jgi:hypothetical protein
MLFKDVIIAMTVGKDVSSLFIDIVKTEDLETAPPSSAMAAFHRTSSLLLGEPHPLLLLGSHVIWWYQALTTHFVVVCFVSCKG